MLDCWRTHLSIVLEGILVRSLLMQRRAYKETLEHSTVSVYARLCINKEQTGDEM